MVKSKGLAVPGPGVGRSVGGFRKLGTSPQEKRMREHSEASGIRTSSPVITRWRRGGGSSGGQGSLAKALSWADPITFGGGGRSSLRDQRKQSQSWQSNRGLGRRGADSPT